MADDVFEIDFENGDTKVCVDTLADAEAYILRRWPDAEIGHDGDLSEGGDRTLFWECEEDSVNDAGYKALGSIRKGKW